MKVEKIICDECGAVRKDANHWFMVHASLPLKDFSSIYFNPISEDVEGVLHICGQACGHKILDRWMSTGKIEKQTVGE